MELKLYTFLTLCQTMNYRLAAERLHLSQPAVTKQIQSLEQSLQTKLFYYDGHTLHKTGKCLLLERYAISQQYQFEELQLAIADKKRLKLRIGATKTIGDYVLIDAIRDYLSSPSLCRTISRQANIVIVLTLTLTAKSVHLHLVSRKILSHELVSYEYNNLFLTFCL